DLQQDGAGDLVRTRSYVQFLSVDSKIALIDLAPDGTNSALHWYVPDALGSVHQILNAQGSVENISLSSAWGEKLSANVFTNVTPVADRHGFTQRENLADTG